VQGVVAPGRQFTKGGARDGDALVLSKPLGTGLALASGDPAVVAGAVASMRRLNRAAAAALRDVEAAVHAVTDVTGFGLLGHGWEMADRSGRRLAFESDRLPVLEGVASVAEAGVKTGGDARNRDYVAGHVTLECGEAPAAIAFDPQTSGGLLAAVDPSAVEPLAAHGFVEVGRAEVGPAGVALH
jgi:selenide, water dikinase